MAFKFEKLKVWQKALDLADEIDKMTKTFPKEEIYILTSQVKRAADSISMNIAEGSTGQSNPEFCRFLRYSLRSDIEVVNCLHLAIRRGYITEEIFQKHYQSCEEILIMISALIKSLN
ncbi:four helix bundle protein [Pedobacter sp. D749]|uniref:four helix bundle protein n=1 Tax=Pedobacter sp. D749 TaxID=2856523 RepID=UPI001C561479|nr:four helix bundle protein [Pedobacter sp. D749]QXU40271.1 four helix bundle protein [Pedobacter sp. D749]